jgi:hypothetical protein
MGSARQQQQPCGRKGPMSPFDYTGRVLLASVAAHDLSVARVAAHDLPHAAPRAKTGAGVWVAVPSSQHASRALPLGPGTARRAPSCARRRRRHVFSQGAEIITIDGNYSPEGGGYQPKVATWGVFPRPSNISRAYGGGRNIPPGQALESKEAAEERRKRVSQVGAGRGWGGCGGGAAMWRPHLPRAALSGVWAGLSPSRAEAAGRAGVL